MGNRSNDRGCCSGYAYSPAGALTLVFIILKLTGAIAWGWFWVLSPTIFTIGLTLLIIGIIGFIEAAQQ